MSHTKGTFLEMMNVSKCKCKCKCKYADMQYTDSIYFVETFIQASVNYLLTASSYHLISLAKPLTLCFCR